MPSQKLRPVQKSAPGLFESVIFLGHTHPFLEAISSHDVECLSAIHV